MLQSQTRHGASGAPIRGSFAFAADGRSATFVADGGLLSAGTYRLTLRSDRTEGTQSVAGWRSLSGAALDGERLVGNGEAGGDYVNTNLGTIASFSGPVLSVGADLARGPGQELSVPALGASRLPVLLNTGSR